MLGICVCMCVWVKKLLHCLMGSAAATAAAAVVAAGAGVGAGRGPGTYSVLCAALE